MFQDLLNRVKLVLLKPKEAWQTIQNEDVSMADTITKYVVPLAIIPAVASFIGFGLIGVKVLWVHQVGIQYGVSQAISAFIGPIIGVLLSAWVISLLAPTFNTKVSMNDSVKMVGYSYTPMLIAGILYILPSLTLLATLAGLYGLYILYLGFEPITKVSEDKKTGYFVVSLIVMVVASIVIGLVIAAILGAIGMASIS